VFIVWLVAVFQQVFGAIRVSANPHKYRLFENLLAFFDSSPGGNKVGDKANFKLSLRAWLLIGGDFVIL
jgi:hypothetical protein